MEDYIYLIVLIAWAVFAFYRNAQKKKAAAGRSPATGKAAPGDGRPASTLEEILFGEEQHEPEPAPESPEFKYLEQVEEVKREPVSLEKLYMRNEIESLEEPVSSPYAKSRISVAKMPVPEAEELAVPREHVLSEFDLRKAVIYAEILRRPYD